MGGNSCSGCSQGRECVIGSGSGWTALSLAQTEAVLSVAADEGAGVIPLSEVEMKKGFLKEAFLLLAVSC